MDGLRSLILSLIEDGIFGDVKFVSLLPDDDTEVGTQSASSLAFLNLTVSSSSRDILYPLVVKLPFEDPELSENRNTSGLFSNEVTMYKEVLPGLGFGESNYPKVHYGVASGGSDCLILENLRHKNFELSRMKPFLDFNHILLVVKKIAEFHSLSYIMKHENRTGFYELCQKVKNVILPESTKDEFEKITAACIVRGIKPLIEGNKDAEILCECMKIMQRPFQIKEMIAFPEEPFAVICHGDFCNNNVLYKYDTSGVPLDCVLFDFQFSQYASPAMDLFFFLYMHTTSEFREKYWDETLKMYWDSLRNNIPGHIDIPDFQQYLHHFSKRAVYGYIICSWFLPALMEENYIKPEEYKKLIFEEKLDYFLNLSGDEGEKIISEVVSHMLQKGYIKEFVEFCKEKDFL